MTTSPRTTTPLRQRMIEDMKLRILSPRAVHAYVDRADAFAKYLGKPPQLLGPKEVRAYLVFLVVVASTRAGRHSWYNPLLYLRLGLW
jgi:integrase/recombinase XerD